ncbi:hypothetical protein ACVWXO_005010 [Bradyrhizobium sp. LM2.7]
MARTKSPAEIETEAIIAELTQMLGVPYRLGGFKPTTDRKRVNRLLPHDEAQLFGMAHAQEALRRGIEVAFVFGTALDPDGLRSIELSEIQVSYLKWLMRESSASTTKPSRGRGRPSVLQDRNQKIVAAIEWVVGKGIPRTRDRATADKGGSLSACAIVAEALRRLGLHMSERNIEDIWAHKDPVPVHRPHWASTDAQAKLALAGIPELIGLPDDERARIDARLKQYQELLDRTPTKK